MSIVAAESVSEFFLEVVEGAIKARKVEATGGATSYLVCLLADYAKPDERAEEAMERPLSFLLDEALHTVAPAERFDRLRALGDGVLYTCGFFGEHLEARGIDQSYVIGIGTTAYGAAASMLRMPAPTHDQDSAQGLDIYGELSAKFPRFVEVLTDVADATIAHGATSSRSMLKLYERWLRTGSDRLAQALTSHGLVPTRGTRGMLQ